MKRIFRFKMVTVLAVILIVLLPSCQTTEPVDIADVPAIVLPTLQAAAEAAAPEAEETQPEGEAAVSNPALTLDYLGYTVSVTAADGYAEIIYPEAAVTVSDAQAFLLYEAEKYGDEVSGVVYDVSVPGTIMLTYPEGIPEETRYGFASSFLEDIVEYVEMLYPAEAPAPAEISVPAETICYDVLGYTAEFTVEDGRTTLALPPVVIESDVDGFFAYEVAKYGSYVDGICYSYTGNAVELTYPETISRDDVKANLPAFVDDIAEYATTLAAPAAEPVAEAVEEPAVPVAEIVSYEVLGYTAEFTVEDGKTTLALPPVVIESDVDGFFAYEVAKYGSYVDGIRYSYTGNAVELTYPGTISRADVKANLSAFVDDIAEYAGMLAAPAAEAVIEVPAIEEEPAEVISYEVLGYTAEFTVEDGKTTLALPPVVIESDVDGFFAYEVAKYGSYVDGICYSYTGNAVELTYPETISRADVKANLPAFVDDIAEYAATLAAPAEEPEPAVIEVPVIEEEPAEVISYEVLGYTAEFTVEDGKTTLALPPVVIESDVDGFFAYEVAKYGSYVDGIRYSYTGNAVELTYPETISRDDVKANLPAFVDDIAEYAATLAAPAEEPEPAVIEVPVIEEEPAEVISYDVLGYTAEFAVEDGKTTLALPPVVTKEDADGFFAYEVAKYGSYVDGICYSYTGDAVELTYPESISRADVKANLPAFVDDIAEYAGMLAVSVTAEEPTAPVPVISEPEILEPAVVRYSYLGSEFVGYIFEGELIIELPAIVTDDDVTGFFASEVEKYGQMLDGVYYGFVPAGVSITYPASISPEEVKDVYIPLLAADIVAYAESLKAEPAVAEEAPVIEEEPAEVISCEVLGYTAEFTVEDGRTTLALPPVVIESDVDGFFAYEVAKYGSYVDGICYNYKGDAVELTYPGTISRDDVKANLPVFVDDIAEYVATLAAPALEPEPAVVEVPIIEEEPAEVISYEVLGYTAEFTIEDGRTILALPPVVIESDVDGFFAYEVAKYGSYVDEICYSYTGNAVELTYPETISRDDVKANLPAFVDDIAEYAATLAVPAEEPEPAAAETVAEIAAEPELIEYPFGVQPITKNDQGSDDFDLFIIHTNDVHGRIVEEDGQIGYSRLATLLNMARSMTDNILVLDAGDTLHGTILANYSEGQAVAEIMDMLGYDAMVPGNHDFNYGFQRLEEVDGWARENGSFRILSANISDEDGYLFFQPYQIYDFNGFSVCVLGLTTPDTKTMSHPANTEGVEFLSQAVLDNAQKAIDLAHELADYVVVLGHIGYEKARPESITSADIAAALDGIDLFIDGHSHTVMDGGEMVNGTLIVSAGEYMKNLGVVDIKVRDGEAVSEDAFLIPASDVETPAESGFFASLGITSIPSNPDVDGYIAGRQAELDEALGEVIGYLPMSLDGERAHVRTRKTNLSKMICEAMTAESGADFSIINGGSIRASLKAGPFTAADILNVLPFANYIVTCETTPAGIYAMLEDGYATLPEEADAFAQTDLKVVYSASAPQGEKVRRVYLDGVLLDPADDATVLTVATNDFIAAGGDNYGGLGSRLAEGRLISEVFQDHLEGLYPRR